MCKRLSLEICYIGVTQLRHFPAGNVSCQGSGAPTASNCVCSSDAVMCMQNSPSMETTAQREPHLGKWSAQRFGGSRHSRVKVAPNDGQNGSCGLDLSQAEGRKKRNKRGPVCETG